MLDLQLFAEGDKTEDPTPRRLEEARKKGQVPKSSELNAAVNLLALTVLLLALSPTLWQNFLQVMRKYLEMNAEILTPGNLAALAGGVVSDLLLLLGPVLLTAFVAAVAASYLQVGFLFTPSLLAPKLERINPLSGLQRIFSKRALVELLKSILKVVIVALVAWNFLRANFETLFVVLYQNAANTWEIVSSLGLNLAIRIAVAFAALAAADLMYQRYEYYKSLKMSKQEIKDELKEMEGDPQLKARIRETQRKIAMQRMLHDVPSATVVITNPTELAVALRYREKEDEAPVVVAKGAGVLARRIRELAREHHIPLVENKPVARTLFQQVELGETIPVELYQAVAEILAFVYRTKGRSA
ncbi:MAG: flagellar biosynthesis protein FlhB [Firmicutes bacterium]|nr:flagellar biosynthesis protein FlhB [Bacillota bacterium]